MGGENQAYPDDSLQWLVGTWWVEDEQRAVARGRLLRAFVPHVDQQPMTLVPVGRTQPTEHRTATVRLEPLRAAAPRRSPQLPVAALPEFPGEVRTVYRAKLRPVLVLSAGGPDMDQTLRTGTARWQSAPTLLVAPFYGVDPGSTRGGLAPGDRGTHTALRVSAVLLGSLTVARPRGVSFAVRPHPADRSSSQRVRVDAVSSE